MASRYPIFRLDALEGSGCDTIVSGIDDVVERAALQIIPNPANSNISFEAKSPTSWTILSIEGKPMKSGTTVVGINRIDTKDLVPGFYFLRVDSEEVTTAKFIIQR